MSICDLPGIQWKEIVKVVKICHSPQISVNNQWVDIMENFKSDVKYYMSFSTTFQSKAIISKSLLLSKLSYMCNVHSLPVFVKRALDKIVLRFFVPFCAVNNTTDNEIRLQLMSLAAPKHLGGYAVDYISLHADLFLIKPVMRYMKCRVENIPLENDLFFIEYHIGTQLSLLFGLKVNNCTTHTNNPCEIYAHVLATIRLYNITADELVKGSVNAIYKRIIVSNNAGGQGKKYNRILSKSLPSYLQSFNFKLYHNLLPVKTLFRHYALDNDTCCFFCSVGPESTFHMFGPCEKLKVLWKIASETIFHVTNIYVNFEFLRKNHYLDMVNVNLGKNEQLERILIYFNTVINHSIWKERNEIRYEHSSFSIGHIISKITRSMRGRKNIESKLLETRRIPLLGDLCAAFLLAAKKHMPFDNG